MHFESLYAPRYNIEFVAYNCSITDISSLKVVKHYFLIDLVVSNL